MASILRKTETTFYRAFGRSAPEGKVARLAFWLVPLYGLLWLASLGEGGWHSFFGFLRWVDSVLLFVMLLILLLRWVRRSLLWSLRSKLALTYLLIGLAPVVLFFTLAGLASYALAGQFAIHLASIRFESTLDRMVAKNETYGTHVARILAAQAAIHAAQVRPLDIPELSVEEENAQHAPCRVALFLNGAPLAIAGQPSDRQPDFTVPAWAMAAARTGFRGIVTDNGHIYLRAIHRETYGASTGVQSVVIISSISVDETLLNAIADGLGRVTIFPTFITSKIDGGENGGSNTGKPGTHITLDDPDKEPIRINNDGATLTPEDLRKTSFSGGAEPQSVNLLDRHIRFATNVPATQWATGKSGGLFLTVNSVPSLLYQRLFDTSLVFAYAFRIAFIVVCILFALLEFFALIMARRVSMSVTQSVADLYGATQQIDRGHLDHRIRVTRNDQLAELSRSFNSMTASLQRLLVEQQEKERLQNEISIAQEVQANLFPHGRIGLPTLELHGVCKPARAVSGDYYDFLVFHQGMGADANTGDAAAIGMGIALGDISGKGISAALLMATLHSAVRAYRFASEELVYAESDDAGVNAAMNTPAQVEDRGELFQSPSRILSLLNRHLFRSTQPEKYATLFLAHYDVGSSRLTYSNAGQLPPLVLGIDGRVRRLDCGGTVVGLMDGMHYEEGSVQLNSGDIVIAYSDGVTEPENDFGEFGEERLLDIVRQYRAQPLEVISEQVMQALQTWIGDAEQPDDITLVLARQV